MLATYHLRIHLAGLGHGKLKLPNCGKADLILLFKQGCCLYGCMRLRKILLKFLLNFLNWNFKL